MSSANLQTTMDLISQDMDQVNDLILKRLHSEVALVNQLGITL